MTSLVNNDDNNTTDVRRFSINGINLDTDCSTTTVEDFILTKFNPDVKHIDKNHKHSKKEFIAENVIEIVNDRKTVIEVGEDVVNSITNKELDLHHL